jgi:hypothetical protein
MEYRDWTITYDCGVIIHPPGRRVPDSYGRPHFIQNFYDLPTVNSSMSNNEIVRRILAYILALEEHEVFEHVRYDGQPVINPHKSPAIDHFRRRDYFVHQVEHWK